MVYHRGSILLPGVCIFWEGDIFCVILEGVSSQGTSHPSVVYHKGVSILLQGVCIFFVEGGG